MLWAKKTLWEVPFMFLHVAACVNVWVSEWGAVWTFGCLNGGQCKGE